MDQRNIIEITNEATLALLDVKEEREIYRILADATKKMLPGVLFIISRLQTDDMNFRFVENNGIDKYLNIIKLIIGKDPTEIDYSFRALTEKQLVAFENRKFFRYDDGIFELVNGAVSKTGCKAVELALGISVVQRMSFCVNKKFYGGIILFITKSIHKSGLVSTESELAIEILANMASSQIQRLRDQAELLSREQRILEEQSKYKMLISQLTDVVWRTNQDGSIMEDMNNSFERFFGFSALEFKGNPNLLRELTHTEDRLIPDESEKELYKSGKTSSEYRIVRADGRVIWISDRRAILLGADGNIIEIGGIVSDITTLKETEEKLRKQSLQLIELNKTKDKFFSIIAHDLRSPFNGILGFSDILINEYEDFNDDERLEIIKDIGDSAWKAFRLLDNLLEWSRLQIGSIKIHKETWVLKNIVEECISIYSPIANGKGIQLINLVSSELSIDADRHSINTILRNLINNAIKFTQNSGTVTVEAIHSADFMEISIRDSGIGMTEETIGKLFNIAESSSTIGTNNESGTGLGLILCKDLIEKQGGKIEVKSELGRGSTFFVLVPH